MPSLTEHSRPMYSWDRNRDHDEHIFQLPRDYHHNHNDELEHDIQIHDCVQHQDHHQLGTGEHRNKVLYHIVS